MFIAPGGNAEVKVWPTAPTRVYLVYISEGRWDALLVLLQQIDRRASCHTSEFLAIEATKCFLLASFSNCWC